MCEGRRMTFYFLQITLHYVSFNVHIDIHVFRGVTWFSINIDIAVTADLEHD